MAEATANRRKTKLFLTSISPVYDTHDEVVRNKLKRGKFPLTRTGIIKMTSLCIQLGGIISWVVLDPHEKYEVENISYTLLATSCIGFLGQLVFFLLFSFGRTVKNPSPWINSDIGFNLIISVSTIAMAILYMKMSKPSNILYLITILFIVGGGTSICGCAAIFLMYRFVEDPNNENQPVPKPALRDARKSIFA